MVQIATRMIKIARALRLAQNIWRVRLMTLATHGLGWQKSLPDFRDYTPETEEVRELLGRLPPATGSISEPPAQESLASFFPTIDDQQQLNSSAAHACVDLLQ